MLTVRQSQVTKAREWMCGMTEKVATNLKQLIKNRCDGNTCGICKIA
jgi:hypothetical protein